MDALFRITYGDSGTIEVVLSGGTPWGLSLKGGTESGQKLVISKLTAGGKAEHSGGLRVGDEVVAINNMECTARSEAVELVRMARRDLVLRVKRGNIHSTSETARPVRSQSMRVKSRHSTRSNHPITSPNFYTSALTHARENDSYSSFKYDSRHAAEFDQRLNANDKRKSLSEKNLANMAAGVPTTKSYQDFREEMEMKLKEKQKHSNHPLQEINRRLAKSTGQISSEGQLKHEDDDFRPIRDNPSAPPAESHPYQRPHSASHRGNSRNSYIPEDEVFDPPSPKKPYLNYEEEGKPVAPPRRSKSFAHEKIDNSLQPKWSAEPKIKPHGKSKKETYGVLVTPRGIFSTPPLESDVSRPKPPARYSSFALLKEYNQSVKSIGSMESLGPPSDHERTRSWPENDSDDGSKTRGSTSGVSESARDESRRSSARPESVPPPPVRFSQSKLLRSFRSSERPQIFASASLDIGKLQKRNSTSQSVDSELDAISDRSSTQTDDRVPKHISSNSWPSEMSDSELNSKQDRNDDHEHKKSSEDLDGKSSKRSSILIKPMKKTEVDDSFQPRIYHSVSGDLSHVREPEVVDANEHTEHIIPTSQLPREEKRPLKEPEVLPREPIRIPSVEKDRLKLEQGKISQDSERLTWEHEKLSKEQKRLPSDIILRQQDRLVLEPEKLPLQQNRLIREQERNLWEPDRARDQFSMPQETVKVPKDTGRQPLETNRLHQKPERLPQEPDRQPWEATRVHREPERLPQEPDKPSSWEGNRVHREPDRLPQEKDRHRKKTSEHGLQKIEEGSMLHKLLMGRQSDNHSSGDEARSLIGNRISRSSAQTHSDSQAKTENVQPERWQSVDATPVVQAPAETSLNNEFTRKSRGRKSWHSFDSSYDNNIKPERVDKVRASLGSARLIGVTGSSSLRGPGEKVRGKPRRSALPQQWFGHNRDRSWENRLDPEKDIDGFNNDEFYKQIKNKDRVMHDKHSDMRKSWDDILSFYDSEARLEELMGVQKESASERSAAPQPMKSQSPLPPKSSKRQEDSENLGSPGTDQSDENLNFNAPAVPMYGKPRDRRRENISFSDEFPTIKDVLENGGITEVDAGQSGVTDQSSSPQHSKAKSSPKDGNNVLKKRENQSNENISPDKRQPFTTNEDSFRQASPDRKKNTASPSPLGGSPSKPPTPGGSDKYKILPNEQVVTKEVVKSKVEESPEKRKPVTDKSPENVYTILPKEEIRKPQIIKAIETTPDRNDFLRTLETKNKYNENSSKSVNKGDKVHETKSKSPSYKIVRQAEVDGDDELLQKLGKRREMVEQAVLTSVDVSTDFDDETGTDKLRKSLPGDKNSSPPSNPSFLKTWPPPSRKQNENDVIIIEGIPIVESDDDGKAGKPIVSDQIDQLETSIDTSLPPPPEEVSYISSEDEDIPLPPPPVDLPPTADKSEKVLKRRSGGHVDVENEYTGSPPSDVIIAGNDVTHIGESLKWKSEMGEMNVGNKSTSCEMGRVTKDQEYELRLETLRNRTRAMGKVPERELSQRIEDLVQMYGPERDTDPQETDIDAVDEDENTDSSFVKHSPESSFNEARSSSSMDNLNSTPPRSVSTLGSSETLEAHDGTTSSNDSPSSSVSTSPNTSRPNSDLLSPKLEQLDKEKGQLMDSLRKNIEELREQEKEIADEMKSVDEIGERITGKVKEKAKRPEINKYQLFIGELGKIISLQLSLTQRKNRYEMQLQNLDVGEEGGRQQKDDLVAKIVKVKDQQSEAQQLKEFNDKRGQAVETFLRNYFSDEDFADFKYFVNMKSTLALQQAAIKDKVRMGEERLVSLKCTEIDWNFLFLEATELNLSRGESSLEENYT